jgi:hypothetical protein
MQSGKSGEYALNQKHNSKKYDGTALPFYFIS